MALIPESQYPGKITPSSPAYPYGQARNITVPGDGTGTPWEAALVNDLFGMLQSLLSRAAIVPSGTPDMVGASQYMQALLKILVGQTVSVAGLIGGSHAATVLRVTSYDAGWEETSAGPVGAFFVHYTGGSGTASTIGTGASAGLFYDADGKEWKRSQEQFFFKSQYNDTLSDLFEGIDDATISPYLFNKRPLMSTGNRTIFVNAAGGADFTSLQDALNELPYFLAHEYTYNVADGTYAEDVIVPAFYFERFIGLDIAPNVKGPLEGLEIYGNNATPANVKIQSILFAGGNTFRCKFQGFEITDDGPYADAGAGLEVRRGVEVVLRNVVFNSTGAAVRACSAYGGIITIKEGVHIGSGLYSGAFVAKIGGSMQIASNDPAGNPNSGSATGNLFGAQDGSIISVESDRDGVTPFRFAQFSTTGTDAASGGGEVIEWDAGEKAKLHDVQFANEAYGTFTGLTDGNGYLLVPHGMDIVPSWAQGFVAAGAVNGWYCNLRDAAPGGTNIRFHILDGIGGSVANTSVTVNWSAKE